jgi:multidrug efflux pump subunit AcrA (membrane-fusion protein)
MSDIESLIAGAEAKCKVLQANARNAGKEGKGTHRNAGDSGRVAALYMESRRELASLRALSARVAELEAERAAHHANPADFRYWEGRYRDEQSRAKAAEARLQAAEQLVADLRAAVTTYHLALDRRENGNSAGYRIQDEIQRILDMPWKQGAALAKLKGGA